MTDISDEAVTAFVDAYLNGRSNDHFPDWVRAGLAAALPHLADACDALRAAERSGVSTATPEGRTARNVALSGLRGHSAPTHNPTDTTQED